MGVYQVGEVIKRTRESLSITQEELCDGICSTKTLSRIENGKNTPSRTTFEALMERMGKDGKKYLPFIRSGEIENHIRKEEIDCLIRINNYKEIDWKLEELEKHLNQKEPVNQQYILRIRALTHYELGRIDVKEERNQLISALQCTIMDYKEGMMPNGFLSSQEILLLCNIAITYYEEKKFQKSVEMLQKLQQYFETVSIDLMERAKNERLVLSNLVQALWHNGEKEQSLKIAEKAIALAITGNNAGSLGHLLYDLAYGEHELQKNDLRCKEKLLEAYYVAESCRNTALIKFIRNYVQEKYGMPFAKNFNPFPDYHPYME